MNKRYTCIVFAHARLSMQPGLPELIQYGHHINLTPYKGFKRSLIFIQVDFAHLESKHWPICAGLFKTPALARSVLPFAGLVLGSNLYDHAYLESSDLILRFIVLVLNVFTCS